MGIACLRDFEKRLLVEHGNSIKHRECRDELDNYKKSSTNALTSSISRDLKQKLACIHIAAFVAKNELSLATYPRLIELCGDVLDVDLPRDAGKLKWSSRGIGTGFIHAISSCLLEMQISDICSSTFWSVGFDESTSVTKEDKLLVYLRYLKHGVPWR